LCSRRVIGITVVIIIAHVIDPRYTCAPTEVLGSAKITLPVKLRELDI
jgi:hypothetical protein